MLLDLIEHGILDECRKFLAPSSVHISHEGEVSNEVRV